MSTAPQPPNNPDAEKACLGAMLRDNSQVGDVALKVRPEDFYKYANQKVFLAIIDLAVNHGKPADPVTVASWLTDHKLIEDVGYPYIAELWDSAPSTKAAERYAEIVQDNCILRNLQKVAGSILASVEDKGRTAKEILQDAERALFDMARARRSATSYTIAEATAAAFENITAKRTMSIVTGLLDLDDIVQFRPSELTIVGARPGVGKTAFGINIFWRLERSSVPGLFVSLEQGYTELGKRLLCLHGEVDGYRANRGYLHAEEREQGGR